MWPVLQSVRASVQANLDFRWAVLIRSRLDGLSDAEYLWEPVAGCLSIHPAGGGGYALDPATASGVPFGNIAWRMTHLNFSLSNHPVAVIAFGREWSRPELAVPSITATEAISRLDHAYEHWRDSVTALSEAELDRRLGERAGQYAESTVLDLVLHIQAEALQRGADLCLLRDLYWHMHQIPTS